LLMRIATASDFVMRADKKLTAFLELKSAR
jgi:hypothetical protein